MKTDTPATEKALRNTSGLFRAAAETNGFADHARKLERILAAVKAYPYLPQGLAQLIEAMERSDTMERKP